MQIQADQERAEGPTEVPESALMTHAQALLSAATRAHRTLAAAAKIVRGSGNPKAADVIDGHAAELLAVIKLASGEVPQ